MATKTDFSTPDIPMSDATFYCSACTRINAPASLVFRTLRNTETWKDWNRWIPRVTITYQPDEEDDATLAEIEELVRNTSIAVSYDSEITDGAAMPSQQNSTRRGSMARDVIEEESQDQDGQGRRSSQGHLLPPVTRHRLASNASRRMSEQSNRMSSEAARPNSSTNANGLSGAQKYQAAQEARKASLSASAGETPPGSTKNANAVMLEAPNNPSILMPAPRNTASTALAVSHSHKESPASRRKSSSHSRRQLNINALYGEPSVRIQVGTKMTFHVKMKLPHSQEMRQMNMVASEVSRPDDPSDDPAGDIVARTQTHTLSKSGVYRLVWSLENAYSPPKAFPKFLLQAQRVHEIRPIVSGDGTEMCEYWDWEAQRGLLAKKVKKDYSKYIEERMEEWGKRLGEFCESMGGAVERRDFSVN
ncbi:hypothetical protein LTR72_002290 [Exophiala xenobiotica]|nr:hypothetical protein LTR41_004045 [Exophiala xenobiotica]KAK5228407.1 hypothetical protein LTR72_002290 [Exophiala xenobiotica]KAK5302155.1 hypothetical protein LTR14_000404 [Exophiala xenobiotica]KAK5387983.1 hypothetical protein LTS13_000919 [Exophiala xenobiotica]KAK5398071.1 hypothetical protein LTR79_004353 [Exophiala xenobiotica]